MGIFRTSVFFSALATVITGIVICYLKIYIAYKHDKDENLPVLIWWTKLMPDGNRLIECDEFKCILTNNRSYVHNNNLGGFMFYGSTITNYDFPLPRQANIPWAILNEESPKNYAPFLFVETQKLFNITSTFSRFSNFPITLQYLKDINVLTDEKYFVNVNDKNKLLNSIAPVLYIQSDCDMPLGRDHLVKQLMNYIKIDSYGTCLNNKQFPSILQEIDSLDLYNGNLMEFIKQYKFVVAFENAACDDYITEKLWRPLIAGSIPIYYGSPAIEDWLPNKGSSILVKDFNGMKALGDFINLVNSNDTMYNDFLKHKISKRIDNERLKQSRTFDEDRNIISGFECFVCKSVHNNQTYLQKKNVYHCQEPTREGGNTWNQHWVVGQCQSKALNKLLEAGIPYSSKEFDKMWQDCLYGDKVN